MEQLSNLPPLAIIVFGATLAVIFGVRYLGLMSGGSMPIEKSAAAAQVAAVIVDPTELRKATVALESHTRATHRLADVMVEMTRSVDDLADEAGKVREEIHITRELSRR